MSPPLRSGATFAALLAFGLAALGLCPCPLPATADSHGCCEPEAGLRAASEDCCGEEAEAKLALVPLAAPGPGAPASFALPIASARETLVSFSAAPTVPLAPPLVLRI